MVECRACLLVGWLIYRMYIGTNSCLSFSNSSFIGCRLISITIIGIVGVLAQQLSDLGSSTVRASGSNSS